MTAAEHAVSDQLSMSELDRAGMSTLICRIVSEPRLREQFAADPVAAIDASGVVLSPVAAQALVRNHKAALDLTAEMDDVVSSFFFFLIA